MKVMHRKSRGIGAALRPALVDSDALPPDKAATLERLVAAAKAEPASKGDGLMREEIEIEESGGRIVLDQPVTAMSPAFRALREWLAEHAPPRSSELP